VGVTPSEFCNDDSFKTRKVANRRFRKFNMCFNHSTCKTVLNLSEAIYLRLTKTVVQTVTAVKFGVNNRGSDGRIKVRTDTTELADMRISGLTKWSHEI